LVHTLNVHTADLERSLETTDSPRTWSDLAEYNVPIHNACRTCVFLSLQLHPSHLLKRHMNCGESYSIWAVHDIRYRRGAKQI